MARRKPGPPKRFTKAYLLNADADEMLEWMRIADERGIPFAEWVRRSLRLAAAMPSHGIRMSAQRQLRPVTHAVAAEPDPDRPGRYLPTALPL